MLTLSSKKYTFVFYAEYVKTSRKELGVILKFGHLFFVQFHFLQEQIRIRVF